MKHLQNVVYWATTILYFLRVKRKHIKSITGIEYLPDTGPFIVVANHSSFVDHYLLASLFKHVYNQKVFYLTKKESFESRFSNFWHTATNCIPVDRSKPDLAAFKTLLSLLKAKKIVVIYPEGTRGPGNTLLPFKSGAFRIAAKMKVPIVPIGLVGAAKIMPKGRKSFSPHKASINIGQPISVELIKELSLEELMAHTKDRILSLSLDDQRPSEDYRNVVMSSDCLVKKVEDDIESVLEASDYKAINLKYRQLQHTIDYAMINVPDYIPAMVQKARLIGIKALSSKVDFALNIRKVKRLALQVLQKDRDHAFANYILGQYYLKMPTLLGGSDKKALSLLSKAFHNASDYGIEQNKFALTLAEAHEKNGASDAALSLLETIKSAGGTGNRFESRRERIAEKIEKLSQVSVSSVPNVSKVAP